jgi:hypothetical protein
MQQQQRRQRQQQKDELKRPCMFWIARIEMKYGKIPMRQISEV